MESGFAHFQQWCEGPLVEWAVECLRAWLLEGSGRLRREEEGRDEEEEVCLEEEEEKRPILMGGEGRWGWCWKLKNLDEVGIFLVLELLIMSCAISDWIWNGRRRCKRSG